MYGTSPGSNFEHLLSSLTEAFYCTKQTIEDLLRKEEVGVHGTYGREVTAFVHSLGITSIESSAMSATDKDNLAAGFTDEIASMMGKGDDTVEALDFLEHRLSLYRWAMKDGRGRDPLARLSLRFLQQFRADTPAHAALIASVYFSLVQDTQRVSDMLGNGSGTGSAT